MKKLSFILLLIIIVIVAVIFILPFGMGYITEQKLKTALTSMPLSGFDLQLENYHRGWFSSDATLKITQRALLPVNSANVVLPQSYQVNVHIMHGPFLYVSDIKGAKRFAVGQAALTVDNLQGQNYSSVNLVGLKGDITGFFSSPQFTFTIQNKEKVTYNQLQAVYTVSADLRQVAGEMNFQNASVQSTDGQIQLQQFNTKFALDQSASGIWLHNQTFSLQSLNINVPSVGESTTLSGIDGQLTNQENDNKLNILIMLSIESFASQTHPAMGPYLLNLSINDLDIPSFKNIVQYLEADQQTVGASSAKEVSELIELLSHLVSQGLTIKVNHLLITLPKGKINLQASATFPAEQTASADWMASLVGADASLQLSVDQALAAEILEGYMKKYQTNVPQNDATNFEAQQIQHWIDTGWAVQNGDQLTLQVNYKAGQFTVNGKEENQLPSPMLPLPAKSDQEETAPASTSSPAPTHQKLW